MIKCDQNNYTLFDNLLLSAKERVFQTEEILKLIFDFCDAEDILCLSKVSKKFYKIANANCLDYKFEESITNNYFSNHSNYE